MTTITRPKVFGTGLIALDLVVGPDPDTPARSWAGGTCGNVLSILAYLGWDAYPIARMNDDVASDRVRADMKRWGVHLDWANCTPTAHTPIIVQEIRRRRDGRPDHRFSWSCPHCGKWLPPFKAITVDAAEKIKAGARRRVCVLPGSPVARHLDAGRRGICARRAGGVRAIQQVDRQAHGGSGRTRARRQVRRPSA